MYTNAIEAENFLTGNVGGLGAGKLRYAAWRGKTATPRNFPQETAETTQSGTIHGIGVLPDEPTWHDVNCNNAREWFTYILQNAEKMKTSIVLQIFNAAFLEWVYQEGIKAWNSKRIGYVTDTGEFSFCLCEGKTSEGQMAPLVAKFGKHGNGFQEMEIVEAPCNPATPTQYHLRRIYGLKKWASSENPLNPDTNTWWNSDTPSQIISHYGLFSVSTTQTYEWMKICPSCSGGGKVTCSAPCVADQYGNCMKPCNGKVIKCDEACPGTTVPDTPTGPCPCDCNDVQGIQKFYLSKNKTDSSIPVNVNGRTMKCTPRDASKKYSWDCNNVMSQIQTKLQEMKGLGQLPAVGAALATTATVASQNTPCPCDCVEVDAVIPMYVNLTQTGNDDIPFDVPYTSRVCKPVEQSSKYKVDCTQIQKALTEGGYSMSGLGDCGCGNCNGKSNLSANTNDSWKYWSLLGVLLIGGIYFVVKK